MGSSTWSIYVHACSPTEPLGATAAPQNAEHEAQLKLFEALEGVKQARLAHRGGTIVPAMARRSEGYLLLRHFTFLGEEALG